MSPTQLSAADRPVPVGRRCSSWSTRTSPAPCWSNRQLFEVMVDFWSNHLNVTSPSVGRLGHPAPLRPHGDPQARARAVHRHADGLGAAPGDAHATSTTPAPTRTRRTRTTAASCWSCTPSASVPATPSRWCSSAARLLTGLSVDHETTDATSTTPSKHATGAVKVLGFRTPTARRTARRPPSSYLRYLATHPATARRIARKLAVRFVGDDPPAALVTGWPRSTSSTTPRSRRCCARCSARRSSRRRPAQGEAAVRGHGRDGARAGHPAAGGRHRGDAAAVLALRRARAAAAGLAPAGRLPRRRAAWQRAGGTLARWNAHLGLAAGWWPNDLRRPRAGGPAATGPPATYGALVDAAAAGLALPRPTARGAQRDLRLPRQCAVGRAVGPRRGARLAAALRARPAARQPYGGDPMSQDDVDDVGDACSCGQVQPAGSAGGDCSARPGRRRPSVSSAAWSATPPRPGYAFAGTGVRRRRARRALPARRLRRPVRRGAGGRPGVRDDPARHRHPRRCAAAVGRDLRAAPGARPAEAVLGRRSARRGARGRPAGPDPLALPGDGGDGARGARLQRPHRLAGPDVAPRRAPGSAFATVGVGVEANQRAAARPGTRAAGGLARRLRPVRGRRRRRSAPGGARRSRRCTAVPAPTVAAPGAAHPERARHGGGPAGRGLRRGQRCRLPRRRPGRRAARRRPADQGRGRPAGRHRRLRRLGHARRPRPGRRRLDAPAADRARRGAGRVRHRPRRRRSAGSRW